MELTKEKIIFKNLMHQFVKNGYEIKFNPTRLLRPDGTELYNEKK